MDQRIFYQLCKFNSSSSISRRAHVSLGLKCSYKCSFCYYNKHRNSDFYSEDSIIQYLDFLYKYGIKDIEFTGGEPLEYDRKSFLKIIEYASKKFSNIAIITNGTRKNGSLKDLFSAGINEVLFSLHGYNKTSHEKITGIKNSFNDIINSIDEAKANNIKVRINIVIHNNNYKDLVSHAYLIKRYFHDVFAINYLPINTWDDAANNLSIVVPYSYYNDELYKSIILLKGNVERIAIRYIPFCMVDRSLWKYVYNQAQHIYDKYDWNKELDGHTINTDLLNYPYGYFSKRTVYENRLNFYCKSKECIHCSNFYICDGVQKFQLYNKVSSKSGDIHKDCMFYINNGLQNVLD